MHVPVSQQSAAAALPQIQRRNIVLAGNPNVGKSVIFNALTGKNADVSNYPGTTIDISRGHLGEDLLADTPGVYGVSSFNDEELAARAMILEADVVVNVASALSLDRDLFLTLQLIDMGKPLVLVINQSDEADHRGIRIDKAKLTQLLGVPVIRCVAVHNEGIDEIQSKIDLASKGHVCPLTAELAAPLLRAGAPQAEAVLALEGDKPSATTLGIEPLNYRAQIYTARRRAVNALFEQVVCRDRKREEFAVKLGSFILHPFYGSVIALSICYVLFYQLLGILVAVNLVDLTEKKGMRTYYEPVVRRAAAAIFPNTATVAGRTFDFPAGTAAALPLAKEFDRAAAQSPPDAIKYNFFPRPGIVEVIGNCLAGEYGILTLTVTYLIGLLLPLVLGFYLGLSLLEDSGYLPRLAVLVDRLMNGIGLNGRAIIPLILGLGCVTMATITTRLLSSRREKIIATVLLGVAIPCSAQLGVVSGTLARSGGFVAWLVWGSVIAFILALTGFLLNKALPGKSEPLIIDLPPLRLPRLDNVLKKTWKKSSLFLREATQPFMLAALVVSLAKVSGLLDSFIAWLNPVTVGLLNLPDDPRVATTFILGVVRRDFGAFGLTEVPMTALQAVVAMVVVTLFVPCIATVGVMIKERGLKIALAVWIGSWLCAFVVGSALARVLPPLFALSGA